MSENTLENNYGTLCIYVDRKTKRADFLPYESRQTEQIHQLIKLSSSLHRCHRSADGFLVFRLKTLIPADTVQNGEVLVLEHTLF